MKRLLARACTIAADIVADDAMPDIRGYRLYVNLGASQTRKRLKGVGYGVRKVETAGKNRACIIHTATGAHRRALYAIFAGLVDEPANEEDSDGGDTPAASPAT